MCEQHNINIADIIILSSIIIQDIAPTNSQIILSDVNNDNVTDILDIILLIDIILSD